MKNKQKKFKKVSIIIPVYNSNYYINKLLNSLLNLDYPKNDYEIIVIDNNSSDQTKELVKQYPVKLLEENNIQSSYAARNRGIKNAQYDILAFIDADCIASKAWLKEGIETIVNEEADLVGGQVEFYFSKEKTASELYDSITNMQVEDNIKERGVAKTANLFAKKDIFNKIGLFPEDVQSGGDVQWTARATSKGFKLLYNSKAIVLHPARKFKEIIKKQYRVGKGMP
ncbi:MAG: glycosyltransferase, partial [Promethearchaeota archaeon]